MATLRELITIHGTPITIRSTALWWLHKPFTLLRVDKEVVLVVCQFPNGTEMSVRIDSDTCDDYEIVPN